VSVNPASIPEDPSVDDIQQTEIPDYNAVRVKVETPVRVQQLPAVSWAVQKYNINNAGDGASSTTPVPVQILGNNPRRKRALISVRGQIAYIGQSPAMATINDGFVIASPSYIDVTHQREVWCIGGAGGASEVTVLEENYTN
jgi:hypothetical protein